MRIKIFLKEEFFSFLKIFIFCFAVVFLALNMGTIKRIFNYKIVYGGVEVFQTQNKAQAEEIVFTEKPDGIEISKIKIEAPLVFVDSAEQSVFSEALDRGVVHYPDSSLPGQNGQIIFLGHSAPVGWPKIKYDWVFSDLNELISGDEINIYFNGRKYTYYVKEKVVFDKGEDLPESASNSLVLLTCWPPGVDIRRMAVIASDE